jgi:hypothetical protein
MIMVSQLIFTLVQHGAVAPELVAGTPRTNIVFVWLIAWSTIIKTHPTVSGHFLVAIV